MIRRIKDLSIEPDVNPQLDQFIAQQEDTIADIEEKLNKLEKQSEEVRDKMTTTEDNDEKEHLKQVLLLL